MAQKWNSSNRREKKPGRPPTAEEIARNLTDAEDGFLKGKRYVLMDRDDP